MFLGSSRRHWYFFVNFGASVYKLCTRSTGKFWSMQECCVFDQKCKISIESFRANLQDFIALSQRCFPFVVHSVILHLTECSWNLDSCQQKSWLLWMGDKSSLKQTACRTLKDLSDESTRLRSWWYNNLSTKPNIDFLKAALMRWKQNQRVERQILIKVKGDVLQMSTIGRASADCVGGDTRQYSCENAACVLSVPAVVHWSGASVK